MTAFYKVLGRDGTPHHGGTGTWHLPNGRRPGKWMPTITPVVPCQSGYHLCTIDQLVTWLGPVIWVAEGRGEHVDQSDKHVFGQARLLHRLDTWNDRTARLFAADCAERVLPIYEREHPGDDRPRQAIEVARRCANGDATDDERAAAWAAAGAAARTATRAAAGAAAWAAAWNAAWNAARVAAGVAASAAAWDAASAAAWDAARAAASAAATDAAWDAAWDAARAATRAAATDAARAAATDAAWDAARDGASTAARAAERNWQTARLTHYLEVTP